MSPEYMININQRITPSLYASRFSNEFVGISFSTFLLFCFGFTGPYIKLVMHFRGEVMTKRYGVLGLGQRYVNLYSESNGQHKIQINLLN